MRNIVKVICICTVLILALIIAVICADSCKAGDSPEQTVLPIIETSIGVGREDKYVYNITSVEREMLARLVYREANLESIECQKAIVSVVINRWQDGRWGSTLEEVVYAKGQFAPANLLYCTTPTETNYEAVDYVLENGVNIDTYVLYFKADGHFQWDGYKAYQKIDSTYFGYMESDKE